MLCTLNQQKNKKYIKNKYFSLLVVECARAINKYARKLVRATLKAGNSEGKVLSPPCNDLSRAMERGVVMMLV